MPQSVYRLRRAIEDMSKEHEGYPLRCRPSSYDPRDFKYSHLIGNVADEPVVPIDYRPNLPPVFDQGQRGSCVACASSWTLKAYEEVAQGDYPDQGLSAAFLYSMCKQNDGAPDEEGTEPRVAMKVLQQYGICSEEMLPYSYLTDLPEPKVPIVSTMALQSAVKFKIQTYAQLCASSDKDRSNLLSSIRQALKNEGPFIMALLVCDNFEPDKDNKLPLPQGNIRGGHAIGIAGDLPDQGALILRNSWGSSWGDNGYALLPYEWLTHKSEVGWYIFEAWTATDIAVSKQASRIEITPGASFIMVDGSAVRIDQPAMIGRASRMLLPIRVVGDNMGYKVEWDGKKAILIKPS